MGDCLSNKETIQRIEQVIAIFDGIKKNYINGDSEYWGLGIGTNILNEYKSQIERYEELKKTVPSGKTITLCGSTKFKKEFEEWNIKLSHHNNVVLSVVCYNHADQLGISDLQKEVFDEVHKRKIDMSDEIFVIDVDHYIGESTRKEIIYAHSKGKIVRYLSNILGID